MHRPRRFRLPLAVAFAIGLPLVLPVGPPGRADDGGQGAPRSEKAVVWEVFHGDGLHRLGQYVREVYLPGRGIAFRIHGGDLRVFHPSDSRYAPKDDALRTWGGEGGVSSRLPVFHVPGTEPRRVGEIEVSGEDAERLEELYRTQRRLRAVARAYLEAPASPR